MGAIVLALQALFRKHNWQMWYLRPGCGKSLMLQIIGWLYLTTNAISKVTFVIPDKVLLERDVAEFAGFWGSLQKNRVEFSVEMPQATSPDQLVLIDEADMLMFGNPKEFFTAIKRSHHCICFSSSLKGNWQPVLDQLCAHYAVKQMVYSPNDYGAAQAIEDFIPAGECNLTACIVNAVKSKPVIVYTKNTNLMCVLEQLEVPVKLMS